MVVEGVSSFDEETVKEDKKHRLKQRFDVRQKLGQGTYGKVQLALNRETNQEVAIKTIKKSKIESEQDLIRIRREIQIMSSIQHPHIIHIYEVFENKDKIVLVMQFASGGELYDYLSEKKVLSDLEARRIFRQIAAAVYYCHKNKICHRDLKLENILLDEKGNAKIADFGLSNVFDERHLLKTYCGSPLYASPEIVKGVPYYGPEVDCWSMGVLLYTLVYGAMPFDGSNFKKLVTQISEGEYFEPKKKSKASDLIQRLLTVNPLKRATIVDICTDFWVNQGYEHSLLQVAEDMANLTPVRLDLLLALAPASPVPASDTDGEGNAKDEGEIMRKTVLDKEVEEEEEEEEEENPDTMANSFAFVRGSQISNFSASTPDLQKAFVEDEHDDDDNFIPSGLAAAMEGHCGKRPAEGSLAHVSSMAHKSKKTRKSDSTRLKDPSSTEKEAPSKNEEADKSVTVASEKSASKTVNSQLPSESSSKLPAKEVGPQAKNEGSGKKSEELATDEKIVSSDRVRKSSIHDVAKSIDAATAPKPNSAECDDNSAIQKKKMGRPPGKIVIPKTFESPQSTPSPRSNSKNSPVQLSNNLSEIKLKTEESCAAPKAEEAGSVSKLSNVAEKPVEKEAESSEVDVKAVGSEQVTEEKKLIAKGILKKGIAKAKLAERKLSQQSSVDSDISAPPTASVKSPESTPSFYKTPKPYTKEEDQKVKSEAVVTLSSAKQKSNEKLSDIKVTSSAPLWDSAPGHQQLKGSQSKNMSWGTISSTLDSEIGGWRESVEESLKRLSPEGSTEKSLSPIGRSEDDKPLVPIARSYKKFTFTKDGACITETKKIYTTPGADGSWTKVEKKTRITTRPGNADEFEKFRDLHLRNSSPLTKSDSQSSSGSNDMYDDIFDSWTGDSMMCNMVKIRNMFQKFSQDPFMRSGRRRNPFRNFRRTESDRSERNCRQVELPSGHSTDKESSDNDEEDYEVAFAGSNPVVYGSQGLWHFLRAPPHRRLQRHVMISQPEHTSFSRSISQDRSGSKVSSWKQLDSRASSGYNTSRSQSRDRTQSPHEKVLRFVFESPSAEYEGTNKNKESWAFKRSSCRRDSGINSDGYESEHSYRRVPSEDFSKSGRVSPISMCSSGRPGIIREFVKSWPKEVMMHHNKVNEAADNRRHKVEQWLHMNDMNDDKFPFNFHCEPHPRMSSARKTSIHDNISSAYATMRPREYLKYNRSSSDKISTSGGEFFPFSESCNISRNHSKDQEFFKGQARATAYSPVSEDSTREAHSLRNSDSSHSNTSVHHINFTISDGRVSTSQCASPSSKSYAQQRSDGDHNNQSSSRNISSEPPQISVKNSGQPVVEMRVSFNRGNRDNKVVHIMSQPASSPAGLWQQQDQTSNSKVSSAKFTDTPREPSPIPGIKKFSTEMVHTVGSTAESSSTGEQFREGRPSSIECEVKATVKNQASSERGKLFGHMPECVCSDNFFDACSKSCMENAKKNTNLNLHPYYSRLPNSESCDNEQFSLPKIGEKEVNTPDSLEDSNFDLSAQPYDNPEHHHSRSVKAGEHLEIKPIGVLWSNSEISSSPGPRQSSDEMNIPPRRLLSLKDAFTDSPSDSIPKSHLWGDTPCDSLGSIWEQKNNNCQTFDLIKELLSDDALDNSVPSRYITEPAEPPVIENKNIHSHLPRTQDAQMLKMQVSPLTVLDTFSVIEGIKLHDPSEAEFASLIPSVMDDLQSPKKVLHQALRIGKSLQSCE